MKCAWCGYAIWLNVKSGEWSHLSTAEKTCSDSLGSKKARPVSEGVGLT